MNRLTIHNEFQFAQVPGSRIVSMLFPKEGLARDIMKAGSSRPRYTYPSWKTGESMYAESLHEVDAFKLLDADPTVTTYFEQPVTIEYQLGNDVTYHIPDILVIRGSKKELWEVKPKKIAERDNYVERTALMMDEMPKFGFSYHMVIGEDLARKPRINSVNTVLRHGRAAIPMHEREEVRLFFENNRNVTWEMIRNCCLGKKSMTYACRLMLEGTLLWNPDEKLTSSSQLTWNGGAHSMPCLGSGV